MGTMLKRESLQVKKKIGLVPETSNLYGELTALENLIYQSELYGISRRDRKNKAIQLIEEFGLLQHRDKPFQSLSRGLKRRISSS